MQTIISIRETSAKLMANPITSPALFFLFRISLDFSYILSSGAYRNPLDINPARWLFATVIMMMVYILVHRDSHKHADLSIDFLLWFSYAPVACYYCMSTQSTVYYIYISVCFIIMRLIVDFQLPARISEHINSKLNILKEKLAFLSPVFLVITIVFCAGCTIMTMYALIKYTNILNIGVNLDIRRVYEVRLLFQTPSWANYIIFWQANVVNIFIACILLFYRKYWFVIFPTAFQIIIYLLTGHKSTLLGIVLCAGFMIFTLFKKPFSVFGIGIIIGTIILSLGYYFSALEILRVPFNLLYRSFLSIAQQHFYYYDFFSTHSKLFFTNSRVGNILGFISPYPIDFPRIIGLNFFGSASNYDCTSFIATAYADLGFAGMSIISVLTAFIFKYFSLVTKNVPAWFFFAPMVTVLRPLNDTGLFTTLGTHGMLLLMILLTFWGLSRWLAQKEGALSEK